jgi:hypothetical protein
MARMRPRFADAALLCFAIMLVPKGQHSSPFSLAGVVKKSEVPPPGLTSVAEGSMSMSSALASMSSMAAAGMPSGVAPSGISDRVTAPVGSSQAVGDSPTATKVAPLPHETCDYGTVNTPDEGYKWGNATVVNQCNVTFNINTIGGFRLNGTRTDEQGFGTPEEQVVYSIAPGGTYSEAFRSTWVAPDKDTKGRNPDTDKLWGQGISIKISWADKPHDANITQFEYTLTYNPRAQQSYPVLWYDVSLLNCGMPAKFNSTDFTATDADYQIKTEQCPGYQGGLSLKFEPEAGIDNTCPEIDCKGKCHDIYNFDRTREEEPTKQCGAEFKGNMILHLCAGEA